MQQLISSNEEFSRLSAELNNTIASLTVKLSDFRVKATEAKSSMEEIKARQDTVDESIKSAEAALAAENSKKEKNDAAFAKLDEKIAENSNSVAGFGLRQKGKVQKAEELKEKLEKLSRQLSEKESKARMLSDLEKNMEGYSGAVKAVMRRAREKALGGIHGPLSQLIQVDNEYSTAVEVALGAAMQNIVTSTEADAKRAIYYLKENNVGSHIFADFKHQGPHA